MVERGDKRVARSTSIVLTDVITIQEDLDALDGTNVQELTIRGGFDDGTCAFNLNLARLKKLVIDACRVSELILTSDNTPRVTDLTLINLGEVEPENFNVSLPKLKHVVIHFLTIGSDESINTILHTARKLESFESYKLWTFPELEFASNALESINIRRSYCPERVSMWAPRRLSNMSDLFLDMIWTQLRFWTSIH